MSSMHSKKFLKADVLPLLFFFSFILGVAHNDPLFVQTAGPKIAMFRGFT